MDIITVYQRVRAAGITHTQKDLENLGINIYNSWIARGNSNPRKVKQQEGEQEFWVYAYPTSFRQSIDQLILRYFLRKMTQAPRQNGTKV